MIKQTNKKILIAFFHCKGLLNETQASAEITVIVGRQQVSLDAGFASFIGWDSEFKTR